MKKDLLNTVIINGKEIKFEAPIASMVTFANCICVQLENMEDNLVCASHNGEILWRGSKFYTKNTTAKIISQVAPELLKVVWNNNDVKVINVIENRLV